LSRLDMNALRRHITEIPAIGGTNFEAGYKLGVSLFNSGFRPPASRRTFFGFDIGIDPNDSDSNGNIGREKRIIFLTDAQPNAGDYSESGLYGMTKKAAENSSIYTTFIGIGVDFNTDLIKKLTDLRGGNYYAVHSGKEFKERMDEGFDYMVSPLVFDLKLTVQSDYFEIAQVFGSPQADETTGEIMHVATLFPSRNDDQGQTKGGVVLMRLRKKNNNNVDLNDNQKYPVTIIASYVDRYGRPDEDTVTIEIDTKPKEELHENTGVTKAIALSRYATVLQYWMIDSNVKGLGVQIGSKLPLFRRASGLTQWERRSIPLTKVSVDPYREQLLLLLKYLNKSEEIMGQPDEFKKEEILIEKLLAIQ